MENETIEVGLPQTMEELQALLQKEGDKRVTEAMKKAERKKEAAIQEAQRLARMDEEEKFKYQLEQRETELKAREEKLTLAENKVEASRILAEKKLPVSLVDLVVALDAETMNSRIKGLEEAFSSAVKTEVENRLKGTSPITGTSANTQKTNYSKMSLAEISETLKNGG